MDSSPYPLKLSNETIIKTVINLACPHYTNMYRQLGLMSPAFMVQLITLT